MKKVTAILFISLYLFTATECNQLLKLPVIFEHFAEHRLEDKSISFLQFLAMHYLHGSPKDNDYDRDMQLPFKTIVECSYSLTTAAVPRALQLSLPEPIALAPTTKIIPQDRFKFSSNLADIWQPPRHNHLMFL
ncbi:MAG: hypothetical protein EOP51_13300 [Sphingobacteriales bacterium]|nr:MAG: hypothetical protein EOP51_13300 [Sphingobacteriales bacterium]